MDPELERQHLEKLDQLIAGAQTRITEQEKRVVRLRNDGHSTMLAEETLAVMKVNLHALETSRATIIDTLRGLDRA